MDKKHYNRAYNIDHELSFIMGIGTGKWSNCTERKPPFTKEQLLRGYLDGLARRDVNFMGFPMHPGYKAMLRQRAHLLLDDCK